MKTSRKIRRRRHLRQIREPINVGDDVKLISGETGKVKKIDSDPSELYHIKLDSGDVLQKRRIEIRLLQKS